MEKTSMLRKVNMNTNELLFLIQVFLIIIKFKHNIYVNIYLVFTILLKMIQRSRDVNCLIQIDASFANKI